MAIRSKTNNKVMPHNKNIMMMGGVECNHLEGEEEVALRCRGRLLQMAREVAVMTHEVEGREEVFQMVGQLDEVADLLLWRELPLQIQEVGILKKYVMWIS